MPSPAFVRQAAAPLAGVTDGGRPEAPAITTSVAKERPFSASPAIRGSRRPKRRTQARATDVTAPAASVTAETR